MRPTYILDCNTISEIFRSYYKCHFPSFWERFDVLVRTQSAVSVRAVRAELENASRPEIVQAIPHLEGLNPSFFQPPDQQEQRLVRKMINDPGLSAACNRWRSKSARGIEDADPYLVASGRVQSELSRVVTLEHTHSPANVPAVCRRFSVPCINLQEMMSALEWRF